MAVRLASGRISVLERGMVGALGVFQIVGMLGGLFFTGAAFHRDATAREVENLLTLAQMHKNLWEGKTQQKELHRIFQGYVDVSKEPPTLAEREFMNLIFVHFEVGWRVARTGAFIKKADLRDDLREF